VNILIIGLTSSALGGMELHNLGNYAVLEPLIQNLRNVFPNSTIKTSMQLTKDFQKRFNIKSLNHKRFYTYGKITFFETMKDFFRLFIFKLFKNINMINNSPLLSEMWKTDIIIDFSGDIYGDNARINQFLENSAEIFFAKSLGKRVVFFANSPGPFKNGFRKVIAKYIFKKYDLIINREKKSTLLLKNLNIKNENIYSYPCPSFLFEGRNPKDNRVLEILRDEQVCLQKETVGLCISGWNMPVSPFSKYPRDEKELTVFVDFINFVLSKDFQVIMFSHSNRTDHNLNFLHGPDYYISKQIIDFYTKKYGKNDNLKLINGLYDAKTMKGIIGNFDILISGRLHAAMSGLTQIIPTLIIDYGHEPKAHKLEGFAMWFDDKNLVCNPNSIDDMKEKFVNILENKDQVKILLANKIPILQKQAFEGFLKLTNYVDITN